jgi:hypothetical protein
MAEPGKRLPLSTFRQRFAARDELTGPFTKMPHAMAQLAR